MTGYEPTYHDAEKPVRALCLRCSKTVAGARDGARDARGIIKALKAHVDEVHGDWGRGFPGTISSGIARINDGATHSGSLCGNRFEIRLHSAGSVEREARREQELAEAETQQLQLASRTLTDVAWEAMQQGRQVQLRWIGGEMAGLPIAAVGDLIVIRTDDVSAGVGVNAIALNSIETTGEAVETATVGDLTVESFIAWCRMVGERHVRVAVMGGRVVDGVLIAVASDHLLIRTRHGNDVAVMRSQVAAVSIAGDLFVAF